MSRFCVLLILVSVIFDSTFSITFYLPVNLRKCLREEIHKDVLVTGEYEVSDQPNAKTNLKVTRRTLASLLTLARLYQIIAIKSVLA